MNVKARSRVHKTAVLALTFAVMAWMWGGSLVTADADSMRGEPAPVIGQDHPKDPGEVKLFKTAKAVDGMVNTWDITLRAEVKDNLKKSDIVLVGDRSGSMTEEERMKKAKDAAEHFVDSLLASQTEKGTTRIALVSFAEDARTDVELTNDASQLKDAIENMKADGATFTQGGIKLAREMLEKSTADFKHIVLLSDGEPTKSYALKNPTKDMVKKDIDKARLEDGHTWTYKKHVNVTRIAQSPDDFDYQKQVDGGDTMFTRFGRVSENDAAKRQTRNCTSIRLFYLPSNSSKVCEKPPAPEESDTYYDHGNSAIAEAKIARTAGNSVWTIALSTDEQGEAVLKEMANPGQALKSDPAHLESIFQKISGNIGAAVKDAKVVDSMGRGFAVQKTGGNPVIQKAVPETSKDTVSLDEQGTLTWNPGALSTPIAQGSDIKYAELTYRVAINDEIRKADKNADGAYPTNSEATLSYKDADGKQVDGKKFPVPYVKPTLYTIEKKLYDENDREVKTSEKSFKINVAGPWADKNSAETRAVEVRANAETGKLTDLRYKGQYKVEEDNPADYSVTYRLNGGNETNSLEFDPNTYEGQTFKIQVINRPSNGKLAIKKTLVGDAIDKAKSLTYTGTYTCRADNRPTLTGKWTTEGTQWSGTNTASAKLRVDGTAASSAQAVAETPIPVGYKCTVKEDEPKVNEKFYTSSVATGGDVTIERAKTATVTVTNTLNKKPGSISWKKVDADTGALLSGSEWTLIGPDEKTTRDITQANNGEFKVENLEWGTYKLVEKLAPAGYFLDETQSTITIGDFDGENDVLDGDLGSIGNTKVVAPNIPLTGGISRDAYVYAGLMTLVVGLAVTGAYSVRRKSN
ncbi:VWA domain-containing protein [Trueperella pyogenes]|uniref:VWA domain-containing protein n=1 Tax=Trueperella pyogenes TaxID=1661 RepID=UPI0024C0E17C|nr:VWA domain-containing protein [Trueperella pyogenes]WHU60747.1 VWA domain-containing protein [Trueperella pyogenes]